MPENAPSPTLDTHAVFRGRALRVLLLTDLFPKPDNPHMGVWAQGQAEALLAAGADVRVVSPTSWVPRALAAAGGGARAFARCPKFFNFNGLRVDYPRWHYYAVKPLRSSFYRWPDRLVYPAAWRLRRFLSRYIAEWRPDVVLAHHTIPNGLTAAWIKRKLGIPFVTEEFDVFAIESIAQMPGRRRAYEQVAAEAFAMAGAAAFMSSAISRHFPGVRTLPLYMGIADPPEKLATTPRPPEMADRITVVTAAGMYERKCIPQLIHAFAKAAVNHPRALLRLAGDGPELGKVEAAIRETGISDRVTLLGRVDHDRVLQEMAWCDLFMLIGREEPFATVYLEAMASAKPIICCNDGGICELMTDGAEGRSVPPMNVDAAAEALDQLLGDEPLRATMGRSGRRLYEQRLTYAATARDTLAILHEAASSAPA